MISQRDVPTVPENSLAAFLTNAFPTSEEANNVKLGDDKQETDSIRPISEERIFPLSEAKPKEQQLINVSNISYYTRIC